MVLSTSFYIVNVFVSNLKVLFSSKIICFSDWGIVHSIELVFFINGCILQQVKVVLMKSIFLSIHIITVVSRLVSLPCYFFSIPH